MAGDDPVYVCCSNHDSNSHETMFAWRQSALNKEDNEARLLMTLRVFAKISTDVNSREKLMESVKKWLVSIILLHHLLKLL